MVKTINFESRKVVTDLLLFRHDWSIYVDLELDPLKNFLRKEFHRNPYIDGKVNYKSFSLMYNTYLPGLYNYNLVGFDAEIQESDEKCKIDLYCRFGVPFVYIYLFTGLPISLAMIFLPDFLGEMHGLSFRVTIALLIPTGMYIISFLYYLSQLYEGKRAINRLLYQYLGT